MTIAIPVLPSSLLLARQGYLLYCLHLAVKGWATARPNPMVGAVVVHPTLGLVGQGYHVAPGQPHAEVLALQQAGELAGGATLYVNLEPCNHWGSTGPCSQAIIEGGIQHVVFGAYDPNPTATGGAHTLKQAGLSMLEPSTLSVELQEACQQVNHRFLKAQQQQRPFITLKTALTLDARLACRNGASQWITGEEARLWVHHLRAQHQAVLSTASTVLTDAARLTVRLPELPANFQPPTRVVLDRTLRLASKQGLASALLQEPLQAPVWLVCSPNALLQAENQAERQHLETLGCKLIPCPITRHPLSEQTEQLNLNALWPLLWQQGVQQIVVEAGAKLSQSLLNEGWVNQLIAVYNSRILSDEQALTPFLKPFTSATAPNNMEASQRWKLEQVHRWGNDVGLVLSQQGY